MRRAICIFLTGANLAAGCTSFPELDAAVSPDARRAEYPVLTPTQPILDRRLDVRLTEETGEELERRAANLQARARLLRGSVVDDDTRRRLSNRLRALGG